MGFPKIRISVPVVPGAIRTIAFRGLYTGVPLFMETAR